jgi:hypothetical protein
MTEIRSYDREAVVLSCNSIFINGESRLTQARVAYRIKGHVPHAVLVS